MGYSHSWKIPSTGEWIKTWPQLVSDARLIVEKCELELAGPNGKGEPQINEEGIALNGKGDSGHEAFVIEPAATFSRITRNDWHFCKTVRKPYDLVIAAILLRASQLAGDAIKIGSDGHWNEWEWGSAKRFIERLWPGEELKCPLDRTWDEMDTCCRHDTPKDSNEVNDLRKKWEQKFIACLPSKSVTGVKANEDKIDSQCH